jgi:predicted nucleotidyltransferase
LFGSTAREEQAVGSDVDLFFDYEKGSLGLLELIGIEQAASEVLGCTADITPREGLHPLVRDRAEAEAVRVF